MPKMPVFYIPHGAGPCFFMDWTPPDTWNALGGWLRGLSTRLPQAPKALLVISAHWEETVFSLATRQNPELLYDYYGFPPPTYQLAWPAPSAGALNDRVAGLLEKAGIAHARDARRLRDHGVFVPGMLMFPKADIPVVQISQRKDLSPQAHLELGRALEPLRQEGVLLVGSGMSYHNLRAFRQSDNRPIAGADVFATWLKHTVCGPVHQRDAQLENWAKAPGARAAHPREDHLLSLMVMAGAAGSDQGREVFACRAMGAPIAAYSFGEAGV